jgi:LuxR family transcriptional regulator, maltose regulon positive regulatory protein
MNPKVYSDKTMRDTLLATKLYIPAARPDSVWRPRLIEHLNAGISGKLTLISGPAGFGKTSLARDWVLGLDKPVAWLSLDEGDNDLARFFSYLVAALQQIDPSIGESTPRSLRTSDLLSYQALVTDLLNDIAVTPTPFVLVLDDYHLISDITIHEALRTLVERQPPQMHLVITTRADPPLPLARLRAQGHMTEIRARHLRFTEAETDTFFNELVGLDLSKDEVTLLAVRTEGWIAGLQLAALSLRDQSDRSSFVTAFTGTDRHIMDYLVDEVLSAQPGEIQDFLLKTSFLERLSGPLCDRVVQSKKDSQPILEYLEQANLFLVPLDNQRVWFRYHRLFADLLRARFQQAEPQLVLDIHLKAAGWYEQNGFIAEAVRHAFAAQDYGRAADLIEEHGHKRWSLSDTEFLSLVSSLPIEVLHTRPSLGIYRAWTLFISGQSEATQALLHALMEHIPQAGGAGEAQAMHSFANLLLIYIAEMSGKELAAELPDRRALEFVPEHQLGMRNSAEVLYAFLLDQRGEFAASEQLLMTAVRRDMAANGTTAVPICIARIARNWILQGRLREAADLCRKHIDYVHERGESRFFIAGNLYMVLAGILREWNDLEGAEQIIQSGFQANEPWDLPQIQMTGQMTKARWQQARGDLEGVRETLDHIERSIQGKSITPDLLSELRALNVRLWLAQGDREKAWEYAGLSQPIEPLDFRHELDHILLARLLSPAEALGLLDRLTLQAEAGGRFGRLLEMRVIEALALASLKRTSLAIEKLGACLAFGEPQGYLRIFLDEGQAMRELLSAYLRGPAPAHPAYAQRILQAFDPTAKASASGQGELIEALTRRELEVLGLISAGDSNQDIAEKLVISVSAVKKHAGNIYGKLGVSSRTQAVARARQLNLLPPER